MIEKRRIPYHEREHGQLFCDDSAVEIIDMQRDACDAVQVHWALDCAVHGVEHHPDVEHKRYTRCARQAGTFSCQSLVVATGGLAIPQIGASPFGYKLAEQFGIPVVAPKPALVPLALGTGTAGSAQTDGRCHAPMPRPASKTRPSARTC